MHMNSEDCEFSHLAALRVWAEDIKLQLNIQVSLRDIFVLISCRNQLIITFWWFSSRVVTKINNVFIYPLYFNLKMFNYML